MTSSSVEKINTISPTYEPLPIRNDNFELIIGTPLPRVAKNNRSYFQNQILNSQAKPKILE